MLQFALALHVASHVDSALETTRIYWREKLGATPGQARDPRPFAEVMKDQPNQGE